MLGLNQNNEKNSEEDEAMLIKAESKTSYFTLE